MKVFKPKRKGEKSKYYYYDFILDGRRYQGSTRLETRRDAENYVDDLRTKIRKGEVGSDGRPLRKAEVPTLKDFAQRFIDAIQVRCAGKTRTIAFYAEKLTRLLEFEPLASARLDKIDEALIESYVQERRKQVAPATVNRQLATLRRLLRLADEWQVIKRVPRIRMLPGERNREFVLGHKWESDYLERAPQPLRDLALLTLDTGLRIGEALDLEWRDVHLEPANGARFGFLHVRHGKSKNARRNLSLTPRVRAMLKVRASQTDSPYVFPSETGKPYLVTSLDHLHSEVRDLLRLPKDFVIHSLRHTYGTRLGEAGADAFTIMRLMGHSSVTVSQRYVHPTPEAMERAIERLDAMNAAEARKLAEAQRRQLPAAKMLQDPEISTVVLQPVPVTH